MRRPHKQKLTTHHRKPRSIGGTNYYTNLSRVTGRQHEAWHILFSNYSAQQIAEIINSVWLDPDYRLELVPVRQLGLRRVS